MLQTTQIPGSWGHSNLSNQERVRRGTGDRRDLEETRGATFPEREVEKGKDRWEDKGRRVVAEMRERGRPAAK